MPDSLRFASATTTETDPREAVLDLTDQIRQQFPDGGVDLAAVFFSAHFTEAASGLAQGIRRALAARVLTGCTAEGVIGSDEEIERLPAITLVAARLPGVTLFPFVLRPADFSTGVDEASAIREADTPNRAWLGRLGLPQSPRLVLMFGDPFTTPMQGLLDAFNDAFPGVPMIGGMASGAPMPGRNALLSDAEVFADGAVGVALAGDFDVDVIVSQGCRPIGPLYHVTEAERNTIHGLDGVAPLLQVQELVANLGDDDRQLLRSGLFVGRAIDPRKERLGRGDFLIRGVIGVDQKSGAIAVGDAIHEGETVQFHVRDAVTAKEDLEMMLTPHSLFGRPSGAFLFSCNGRGTRLYDHPNGDVSALQEFFPGLHVAGFFCAGEIGPIGGRNFLHGHTASLALIRPRNRTSSKNH
jgi:small ligand-binding sensory domain FIST